MTHQEAIAYALAMFRYAYQERFQVGAVAAKVWGDILADVAPEEVAASARAWCQSEKWPPTPADIRGLVPRFCRCGRCRACNARALERARGAVERGAIGSEDFTPERLAISPHDTTLRLPARLAAQEHA